MDFSDIKHSVRFSKLKINHHISVSSSVVSVAREIRYCVIAAVLGCATLSIIRAVLGHRTEERKEKKKKSSD